MCAAIPPHSYMPTRRDTDFIFVCYKIRLDEICALRGYYAASSGNSLHTFRYKSIGPVFKGQEVHEKFLELIDP
jgi:hypothetical protein